ncbi:hypothetical protein [Corynebacterium neomassiliense]|uniref:hypothetical protein n=1 Tax=Corynebacterium neomassiliense TaxID=2079482 RepID=UPI0010300A81|nr:hypothetical protein [Corynebacterium neomassiliense]
MTDKFEERLATALTHTLGLNPEQVAATLIAQGIVADPVQHQEDLVAIMDKQVRDSEGWSDEFVTVENPADERDDFIAAITDQSPEWEEDRPTWHRRVTAWREVHRA